MFPVFTVVIGICAISTDDSNVAASASIGVTFISVLLLEYFDIDTTPLHRELVKWFLVSDRRATKQIPIWVNGT